MKTLSFEDKKKKVNQELIKNDIRTEEASPNLVAKVARDLGLDLTSYEVVDITDDYNNE